MINYGMSDEDDLANPPECPTDFWEELEDREEEINRFYGIE